MGKYHTVSYGVNSKINSMISLGTSKSDMIAQIHDTYIENGGLEADWLKNKKYIISKNEYLRSATSIDTMREAGRVFCAWAEKNNIKKYEKITRDNMCDYLKYRQSQGLSAWTLSRDLHFLNKIFCENISKKELGLKSRLTGDIQRGRGGQPVNRPGLQVKYRDHITMVRATGMRRSSVTRICRNDFIRSPAGDIVQIRLVEKGGKERCAYVLPKYRADLERIVSASPMDGPIFEKYDRHINSHYYRHEYAVELLNSLQYAKDNSLPYYGGEIVPEYHVSAHDLARYADGYRGHDLEICALVSQNLGHNRIEILKNYIF